MIRYGHGAWHAVATPLGVALLHPALPFAVVEHVWVLLSRGEGLGSIVDALVHSLEVAPSALADFAIATYDPSMAELRVSTRGAVSAQVVTAEITAAFSSDDEMAWSERIFTAPASLDLGPSLVGAAELPLRDGIVRARILRWTTTGADAWTVEAPREGAAKVAVAYLGDTIEPAIHDTLEPVTDVPPMELITSFAASGRQTVDVPDSSDAIDGRDDGAAPEHASRQRPPVRSAPRPISLVVSTGERYALDHGAFVGRHPRIERAAVGAVPELVTVPSPELEISRQHLELRRHGDFLLAVDLGGQNGTTLYRTDDEPVRLHPLEPKVLVEGDELEIGDGIILSFEGLG
jgi:hypothetical protein